eukprot:CAMPEP_0170645138 /NCGR_PEP_ID=MMETSP0224-20130122/42895_1 /TAXON_ID=285029 /ORGANISM="Togula jolla, Strain CCCM 725" /LENGTH=106 /DNA_ID=CAMNT_0010976285 /DNA_START=535 /DNA_END=855 /DNA_ORIENTATION=+
MAGSSSIRVHLIIPSPLVHGGIHIEAGAGAKVVTLILALDASTTRRGIWGHHSNAVGGSSPLSAGLLREVVVGTCQAAKVVEDRYTHPTLASLRRQEDAEGHRCAS